MELPSLPAMDPTLMAQLSGEKGLTAAGSAPTPAEVQKSAEQFEAVIVRQLIAPAIDPLFAGEGMNGGGIYGYMLTSTLADKITDGGGLGFAQMLSREFTAAGGESSPSEPRIL
jgi:peptidoglycan hydrolase FlgJ